MSGNLRTAIAGDIGAIVYLALGFRMMMSCGSDVMRKRAARQDDSRIVILVLVLAAIALSFWTVVGVLSEAKQISGQTKLLHTLLAAATVGLSWLVTQVVFTFHYAHEFYRPDDTAEKLAGGLEFPNDSKPRLLGFLLLRHVARRRLPDLRRCHSHESPAPAGHAARRRRVLLQHGGARARHQHRRKPDLTPDTSHDQDWPVASLGSTLSSDHMKADWEANLTGTTRRAFTTGLAAASVAPMAGLARAQPGYPAGLTIKFIVGFPAGGAQDIVGRVIADRLGALWKVPTMVENVAGAGGNIGIDRVAKGPADGTQI